MRRYVSAFAALLFVAASPAAAQEKGEIGVTMGFPESVGVIWHATEKMAVRPELRFSFGSSAGDTLDVDSQSFGTGLSLLFYLRKWDDLATYISPRYAFSRTKTTAEGFGEDHETTSQTHLFSGSFGAQYWLGTRFSVFGELGVGYAHGTAENEFDDDGPSSNSFATRSAVGVSFYF